MRTKKKCDVTNRNREDQ